MNNSVFTPKIDTKEKMYVLTLEKADLRANMTDAFKGLVRPYLDKPVRNLVMDFVNIRSLDEKFAAAMAEVQQEYYDHNASMVYCNFSREIKDYLDELDVLDDLNQTPTESEAWDIVQMEEIERELLE